MTMHDVITEREMTLEAYIQATNNGQWASAAEIEMACEVVNIKMTYVHDKSYRQLGNGKRVPYVIVLKKEHFYLMKLHKKRESRGALGLMRGGRMAPQHDVSDNDVPEWAMHGNMQAETTENVANPTRTRTDPKRIRVTLKCPGVDLQEFVIKETVKIGCWKDKGQDCSHDSESTFVTRCGHRFRRRWHA